MAAASPSESRYGSYGSPSSPYSPPVGDEGPEWLRGFEASKKTKDGEAPKRRGPKPDSKPAATKRQEMNRLAQRTHRERKDQYAQELEWRVLRAKDAYFALVREKEGLQQENQEMAQLLRAHGIPYQSNIIRKQSMSRTGSSFTGSSGGSISGASSSRAQTVEGSPFQPSLTLSSSNGTMRRSPHSPGRSMGLPATNSANTSNMTSPTLMEPSGYGSQPPIGTAITTDHKASSTGSIHQTQGLDWIFKDDQVSLDFVL
ncbi:MAG: hypothetical protein Q9222_005871 [Ikaeria aurantiellina]